MNDVDVPDLIIHFETPVYYCVSIEEDKFDVEAKRIYLSKNLVTKDGADVFTMKEDYASEKGVI